MRLRARRALAAFLVLTTALTLAGFTASQASPQEVSFYRRIAPGSTAGFIFDKKGPLESFTATPEGWICRAGGYPENTHYARIRYKIPENDGMVLTDFYMKAVIVLPPDFYQNLEGEMRIFNTDNFGTTVNGVPYGTPTTGELRAGIYVLGSGIMNIAAAKQSPDASRVNLWKSAAPIPVGQHTFELAGSLDRVAPWYFKIDGVTVASGTARMSHDRVPPEERVITRMVVGIDGAYAQDTKSISVMVKSFEFSRYIPPDNGPTPTLTPSPTPTFADVPFEHPFHDDIEILYQKGYTAGCATDPLRYCPELAMNRAESSVFVERGIHSASYDPPTPTSQTFADLALDTWAAQWVEGLWADRYTAGCGTNPLVYCPWQGHSRAEGTVFYLRMLNGANFEPAQPTQQTFADVPLDAWYARWVRAAYDAGLIPPCQTTPDFRFCPDEPLSRAMAAYMMVKAKGLIPVDRIEFAPSTDDFANPERGFMRWVEMWPEGSEWPWGLSHPADPADTLVWLNIRLDNYRTRSLDEAALTRIGAAFDVARSAGLKIVARFMYNAGSGGPWSPDPSTWAPDATMDQVLEHIGQLEPLFASHADTLAALQAGFVGHWGEWHSSTNNLTAPANQEAILDALAEALPSSRMLQVRTPAIKNASFGGPLPETDAFSGTAAARIGHHNDCFLASDDDAGTYRSDSDSGSSAETIAYWKDFVAKEGRFTPVGGETCQENPPRSLCPTALNELQMLHWSFINNSYNEAVLSSWVADGCLDTIRLRLGYRLALTEAVLPQAVRPGSAFDLQFQIRNEGFAAMYNPRPVFVVVDGPGGRYEVLLEKVDPRRWASGTDQIITARLRLPSGIPEGVYRLSLWLPDEAVSLRSDPRYAVRFANAQVWDPGSGLNVLTTNFVVSSDPAGFLDPPP